MKPSGWSVEDGAECETARSTQSRLRTNRLKRSPKNTQKSDITNIRAVADFKTPTRVPKADFRSVVAEESPNDSETQHEIIWDPTSPATPVRNGRGRRRPAAFKAVDISDIVNRIAPKNKRPEEAESSLLQWIGDTIPCTPEIREPRIKPKPARINPVEDLLKLAKQFDFNMIQQEEAHLHPKPQISTETTMHEDRDMFFNANDQPASPPHHSEAQRPSLGSEDTRRNSGIPLGDPGLVNEMDDDLDLLFDGSTQQVSGSLSQCFSGRSQDATRSATQFGPSRGSRVKNDSASTSCVAGVGGASESSTANVRGAAPILGTTTQAGAADDFDDDWNDDDLLENSLVMEMTQNPERFSAPQCSSTQKQNKNDGSANAVYQQYGGKVKSNEAQRLNQRRESSQHCWNEAAGHARENAWRSGAHAKNNPGTQVPPSSKVPSMVPGSCSVSKTNIQPKKPMEIHRPVATTSVDSTRKTQPASTSSLVSKPVPSGCVPSATVATPPTFRTSKDTKEMANQQTTEDDGLNDLAAEDLDSIFASDDIWDDGADDDDLFCEACEKVEESMAEPEPPPKAPVSNPTPWSGKVQSIQNTANKTNAHVYDRGATGNRAPPSTAVLPGARNNNTLAPGGGVTKASDRTYKFSRVKNSTGTGSAYNAARQVSEISMATSVQSYQRMRDDNQFRSAAPSVSKDVSNSVATKCSDAEIEKKKQQAMERRRLRMLASQNVQAPV